MNAPMIALGVILTLAGLFVLWVARRARRMPRRPTGQTFPVVEESASAPDLAPWSPTRGFYWFPADALPEDYAPLSGMEGAAYKQFGEDEADALRQLSVRLGKLLLDRERKVGPPITVASIKFQPLNKRKKARTP